MTSVTRQHRLPTPPPGILLKGSGVDALRLMERLDALGLASYTAATPLPKPAGTLFRLGEESARELAPENDTTLLSEKLRLDPATNAEDLEREILLALMLSPTGFEYPSYDALASAVNVRRNIVNAAHKTELAFDTTRAAKRPDDCWTYSEERGFTLQPGKPLIEALRKATQPEVSGAVYAFSCYRATEYVILLGIAEELENCNPVLLERLQRQWEIRAIKSGAFHEVFLVEYGSMEAPLPPKYYVPGDRLWFRNPDDQSSDIEGYEGSWVFYLGGGLFANFWKSHQPYTLTSKSLEIYHWRNATYRNAEGNLKMDESVVENRVHASMNNPQEVQAILAQMMRLRDPNGVYVAGGCIDTSREYPKSVCPHSVGLALPDA